MTTQLPTAERPDTARDGRSPDVLFEEARRRRRRRWMAGSALTAAALAAAALIVGMASGGGGSGAGPGGHSQPSGSGSGAGSAHANASRLFPGAPSSQSHYSVGPGTACPLALRNRYLPAWSGCVTARVAELSGDGRPDLLLIYSRLSHSHVSDGNLPGATANRRKLYRAEQAMLRVVSPSGHIATAPIEYTTTPINGTSGRIQRVEAAALISIAHVSDEPGKEVFLQIQQISSGSTAVAYGLHGGRLVAAGAFFGYGGDSATQTGFQCLAGNPPRVVERSYELIKGMKLIHQTIYGWWNETTLTYAWHGPRLVKIAQSTVKRRMLPTHSIGTGCTKGIG